MIILRDKQFSSYIPYEKQKKDKDDRAKLGTAGLALTGLGSVAGYKTEVKIGDKKIDKKIKSRINKFEHQTNQQVHQELGDAAQRKYENLRQIESNRQAKVNNVKGLFKGMKTRRINKQAAREVEREAQEFSALKEKVLNRAVSNKARYNRMAKKVAANSKRTLRNNASNRALGVAFVGTGITAGAVQALKRKQNKDNKKILES